MEKTIELYYRINGLSIFRDFRELPVVKNYMKLMEAYLEYHYEDDDDEDDQFEAIKKIQKKYSNLAHEIYKEGGDISFFVRSYINSGNNLYIEKSIDKSISDEMKKALKEELKTLDLFAELKSDELIKLIKNDFSIIKGISFKLPGWSNSKVDVKKEFDFTLKNIATKGYGIFAESDVFKIRGNEIIPVKNADYQTLDQLYGYERERNLVLQNTKALAMGKVASNVLLYGDAGTGKSTTVKAAALSFADKGVRLIEFDKDQVSVIPEIAEKLASSPLKFIFFIDDLTFTDSDKDYYALKGILEGNVSGTAPNILVYATSNRRHLLKESMADRQGDDLHLNDTLQETMSLSSRFGLTITFSKPAKDLYLEIVEGIAKEQRIKVNKELLAKAEAFAIRSNGRSPRTAKQFVILIKNNLL